MKTNPSQRHFGLPLAIVASAHAILFLGFSAHRPPVTITTGPISPPVEHTPIEIYQPPVEVDKDTPSDASAPRGGGERGPSSEDRPEVEVDNKRVSIPVEHTNSTPTMGPISVIPTDIGPGGERHGPFTTLSELDFTPHALSRVSPIYPNSMKSAGVTGTVTVMFTVDESGRVADASVVSSTHWEFEQPALRAIFHWRFEPGKRHGQPTSFRMTIPLNFVLEN